MTGKNNVREPKTAVLCLIMKTFSIISIGAESFEQNLLYCVEEVMQNLLKGYFLAINMKINTLREDTERGIVEFLDNIYHR